MLRASIEAGRNGGGAGPALRWGLAGCGDLARRRVGPALASERGRLVAVWGRSRASAEALAEAHGAAVATDDLQSFLAGVDAVYVATPVSAHVPLTIEAIRAGCHVLVEKPVNVGLAAVEPLLAAIREFRRTVGVAYYRRLWPALRRLRAGIESGQWGEPVRARIAFASPFSPAAGHPMAWRLRRDIAGAGVLADAGSHRIDLLFWLFDRPDQIRARLGGVKDGGCESRARLELRWSDRVEAECRFEWSERVEDRLTLEFRDARVTLDPLDSGRLEIANADGVSSLAFSGLANPYVELVADFERAVLTQAAPLCPLSEGLEVDAIILAALRSAGQPIRPVAEP